MKKTILGLAILATITFGFTDKANAQDNNDRRTEMQARQRERLEKELKLTDEQKAKFAEVYTRYEAELATLRPQRQQTDGETGASQQEGKSKKDKKEMTDAEATAELQKYFDQQADQLQKSQQRLDIQKKYCAEFSAFLTPQQLVKVFRQGGQGGQRGQRDGGQRGGQGGRGGRGGMGGGPRGGGFGGGFGGGDF